MKRVSNAKAFSASNPVVPNESLPTRLAALPGGTAPNSLFALGNNEILELPALAILASGNTPASILLAAQDLAKRWRAEGQVVISGFQSPAEQEALVVLLTGQQPIIIGLARNIGPRAVRPEWRAAFDAGRLLIISPFGSEVKRPTLESARTRNRVVAALANQVLIAYAQPGSKTEELAGELLGWGKPVFTLPSSHNTHLNILGAK